VGEGRVSFSPGQLVRHEHEDDPRGHFIEAIVLRAMPERGQGFFQVLVLEHGGYAYTLSNGMAVITNLERSHMNWRVLA
jgi:hypothetical protein